MGNRYVIRERFGAGVGRADISETIATGTVAKSLALPGFARHVIAARAAYGVSAAAATSGFSAGGVNGSSLSLAPGVVVGGSARTFGVRGFDGGTQLGVRAAAGSVEYRAPLSLIGRGVKLLPIFFQNIYANSQIIAATILGDNGPPLFRPQLTHATGPIFHVLSQILEFFA